MRWNNLEDVNILAREIVSQHGLILHPLLSDDMQATSGRKRWKYDGIAKIGGDGGHRRVIHAGDKIEAFRNPEYVIDDIAVFDAYPLGEASRAARINNVSKIVWMHLNLIGRTVRRGPVKRVQANRLQIFNRKHRC